MQIMSTPIKFEIGKVYECFHIETNEPARFMVIREATEEEYLKQGDIINAKPLGNYYQISFD